MFISSRSANAHALLTEVGYEPDAHRGNNWEATKFAIKATERPACRGHRPYRSKGPYGNPSAIPCVKNRVARCCP